MWSAHEPLLGLDLAMEQKPDLILLDINLPGMNGFEVLKHLRQRDVTRNTPVIAVSANAMPKDIERGLEAGFDDYITKPFSVRELKSRIQAVLSRSMPDEKPIKIGELYLDPISRRVKVSDVQIDLSPTEFKLLHYFMGHTDRVFSRAQLLDQVWGADVYVEERTVDVHIRRLRKQLEKYELASLLQTVHGSGYRFSRL